MANSDDDTCDHVQVLSTLSNFLVKKRRATSYDRPTVLARNRKERIAEETRVATEQRLLAEIQRPKYLFEELNTSKVRPASYYIKNARRRHRQASVQKLSRDISFVANRDSGNYSPVSPVNRSDVLPKLEPPVESPVRRRGAATDLRTSQEFMQDFYPDWLKSRQEFLEVYGKMREKTGLNIAEICKRIASHRTDDEKEAVTRWLEHLECFRDLPRENLRELGGRFITAIFEPGEACKLYLVMHQGDPGDCMYVLYRGKVDVIIDGIGKVGEIAVKNPIGEAAIKNNVNRTATIKASVHVTALKLKKQDYTDVLMTLKKAEKSKFTRFLQSVEFFTGWSPVKVQQLSSYLMSHNYTEGQTIYNLGDSSPTFYIVAHGKVNLQSHVDVSQHHRWPVGDREWELLNFNHKFRVTIRTVSQFQFFGEGEVINDWPRQTSAVAAEKTQCLIINRKELFEVLSTADIEKILNFNPLSIPTEKALEKQVLDKINSRKAFNKSLIDAADVDFTPSKRGVMTNKRSIKMKAWIGSMKQRIKGEYDQMRSEIIASRKKTFRVSS